MNSWKIPDYNTFISDVLALDKGMLELTLRELDSQRCYNQITLNGSDNHERRIVYSIDKTTLIYFCQKKLFERFFSNIYYPSFVFGFIKQRSYFGFLSYHTSLTNNKYYLRLDIKNFFDTIRLEDFRECMEYYIDDNCKNEDKEKIIELTERLITYEGHFAQGLITSPDVSNLVFRSLDIRIQKYCSALGVRYSRYADDLLFSSDSQIIHSKRFINMIKRIIATKGFELNYKKTLKQYGRLVLNGYVVTETINVSRKKLTNINKHIFEIKKSNVFPKTPWGAIDYNELNYLVGYRSYLLYLLKFGDNRNQTKIKED